MAVSGMSHFISRRHRINIFRNAYSSLEPTGGFLGRYLTENIISGAYELNGVRPPPGGELPIRFRV